VTVAVQFAIRKGAVRDYADPPHLGHVTRARANQIMNLPNRAPDIQETLLFLPQTMSGRDHVSERQVRPIAAVPDWQKQRRLWREHNESH
jgi:hypothetical protein